jgi:hypothetical protein
MNQTQLDLYTDYLIVTFGYATATGLSQQSLKSYLAFAKSPAHTVKTQANHLFASIVAVFKIECLSISKHLNHFALRAKLYVKAIHVVFDELQALRAA